MKAEEKRKAGREWRKALLARGICPQSAELIVRHRIHLRWDDPQRLRDMKDGTVILHLGDKDNHVTSVLEDSHKGWILFVYQTLRCTL